MCGRYAFYPDEKIYTRFDVDNRLENLRKRYNVAPGQSMPVVTRHSPNTIEIMRWGLIPFWADSPKIGYRMINARSETVTEKPAFRNSFKHKRCLVPANGFFEWQVKEKGMMKIPYFISLKSGDYFSFAGLFDSWKDAENKEIKSYTIITTTPNKLMLKIHDRMPVIFKKEEEQVWIDPDEQDLDKLRKLLKPYPESEMEVYEVTNDVNSIKNDDERIIQPLPKTENI